MTSRKKVGIGIACIAAVLLLWLASNLFVRTEETVDRGYRGQAATNPFYALQELFRSQGIPTRTVSDLRRLPPRDHALWLVAPTRRARPERLYDWASQGGHLVVVPVGRVGEDPLLEALGLRRFKPADADQSTPQSSSEFASDRPAWPLLYASKVLSILQTDGESTAAWMLSIRVGEGTASVLSDGAFLRNDAIGRKDHALIAWQATVLGPDEPAGIWLAIRDPEPSVWVLMSARAWPIAVSLGLWILAGLIFFARRFGPLLEPSPRDRRQLAEHVRATGDYLWSAGCESTMLDAQRRALGARLGGGRQPSDVELEKLAGAAAAGAGLDPEAAHRAVALRDTRDRQEFTRTVQVLETLRRST